MKIENRRRRGFTLAELMVVIVILGLLATLVVPNVIGYLTQGKMTKVKADIRALDEAIVSYNMFNSGRWPESLEKLIEKDMNGNAYLKQTKVPKDPWGNEYKYEPPMTGNQYRIYTLGADGIPGGEGDDRDYSNEDLNAE